MLCFIPECASRLPDMLSLLLRFRIRGCRTFVLNAGTSERFKPDHASLKIKGHAELPKKVSAQDSTLQKAGSLVDRIQIQHGCVDSLFAVSTNGQPGQHHDLYIVRYSRRPIHTHMSPLNEALNFIQCSYPFGHHGHRRSSVNYEVEGVLDSFQVDFATNKPARSGS